MTLTLNLLALSLFSPVLNHVQTPQVPDYFQSVSKIVGKPGTLNGDGSYRINIPRTDVKFLNSSGMPIPPDLGLSTYIALSGTGDKALAVGDVAMLEGEIDGVIDILHEGGFELVALHNHMTTEQPRLLYMHFQALGQPETLAKTFKSALGALGKGTQTKKATLTTKPTLDQAGLSAIFGSKPQVFPSGVLRFSNPRKDLKVTIGDQAFLPGMGLASWAAFYACECGLTMVMGDTCCQKSDLQSVIGTLRKTGVHITAIHNHILGGSQEVEFLHYEGEGDSMKLARGIKECWNGLGAKN